MLQKLEELLYEPDVNISIAAGETFCIVPLDDSSTLLQDIRFASPSICRSEPLVNLPLGPKRGYKPSVEAKKPRASKETFNGDRCHTLTNC